MTILRDPSAMYYLLVAIFLLLHNHGVESGEEAEHRDFQYNSVVDPQTGRYNFAYDTGHDNEIAHSLHMQYRDANGIVRGRYGYTDPHGKLRMVEYEAGPNGFVARGDVGPDEFPHDQTPQTQFSGLASYTQGEDLNLVPRPVQMAGWDPGQDPMGQPAINTGDDGGNTQDAGGVRTESGTLSIDNREYMTTVNNTSNDGEDTYAPAVLAYNERYPRIVLTNQNRRESEDLTVTPQNPGDEKNTGVEYPVAVPLTVNTIDLNPNYIRETSSNQGAVGRSADGDSSRTTRDLPYSYRNYRRPTHDHDAETRTQATGYRVVYRPNHDHYHEMRYYRRPTHDHDAERRYYINRYTHDHDAERRYYVNRQTHDHDAERRYYIRNRQTHNHDAERRNYYRYPYRRRIFYRDDHSDVPHEHYSDIYRNDNDRYHQHSDRHLYGRSQNLQVPATASPRQLKYIPADKYHDKYYYWN